MRCGASTKAGRRCRNEATVGSSTCRIHSDRKSIGEDSQPRLFFKDSLYYPFIEISDEGWLKTACLYWDTICTIVPSRMKPYRSPTARELREAKVLQPLFVNPDLAVLKDVADDVVNYLECPEGHAMVVSSITSPRQKIHVRKFADELRYALIHRDKFSDRLIRDLCRIGVTGRSQRGWVRIPVAFGEYYMTLLATHLARSEGKSLLTDVVTAGDLATKAVLGNPQATSGHGRQVPAGIAEGVLASLILRTVNVGPSTSVKKLLKFREKHRSELGRFRGASRRLVEGLQSNVGANALSSHINTLYTDEVLPAIEDLRGRLRDSRITCGFNNLKISTLMSASPTALGVALSGTALGPFALVAGVGLSVVMGYANYSVQRRGMLRGSPFSYIISAQRRLGRKKNGKKA